MKYPELPLIAGQMPPRQNRSDNSFEAYKFSFGTGHAVFNSAFFKVIWITKGSAVLTLNDAPYKIPCGRIVCISPGQTGSIGSEEHLEGYQVSFSEEFLLMAGAYDYEPFMNFSSRSRGSIAVMETAGEVADKMEVVMKAMVREYSGGLGFRSEILKGLLKILIVYFSRRIHQPEAQSALDGDADFFRKFTVLVEKNFVSQKNVADYADALRVTPGYLSETVKKVSGYTASHHIQQRIVLEAKRAAIFSGQSMKEIAYALGFPDIAHFSKFFKNKCGVNFSDFKRGMA